MLCCFWCVRSPGSIPADIDSCTMWIDILFNDQNAIDIKKELARAERIYQNALFHAVLFTPTVLTRAWCLFEILTRKSSGKAVVVIGSDEVEGGFSDWEGGDFFQRMEATVPSDLAEIKDKILKKYVSPEKFNGEVEKMCKESKENVCGLFCLGSCWFVFFWLLSPFIVLLLLCCGCCMCFVNLEADRLKAMYGDEVV